MSIAENIQAIRARMDRAAREAGRYPAEILLVGASKMNDAAACREAVAAGIDALGENRVQEMTEKLAQHAYDGAPLHFIGHLQRNKVRQVVGNVSLIHSAGSLELLEEIDRQAKKRGLVQDVLLEVNIGREENKGGVMPEALVEFIDEIREFPGIHVKGLMAIPPICSDKKILYRYFTAMEQYYVDIRAKSMDNVDMVCLSMGMSSDFPEAIESGATMVRVGSSLFGARA